jgi:hypothetical protein
MLHHRRRRLLERMSSAVWWYFLTRGVPPQAAGAHAGDCAALPRRLAPQGQRPAPPVRRHILGALSGVNCRIWGGTVTCSGRCIAR